MTAHAPIVASQHFGDVDMIRLAREIAMDMRPLDDILDTLKITQERYNEICSNPRFQKYLQTALEEWNSALNTSERVKIKSMAFVEEALPEFYARAHDPKESLAAKTEVLKAVARFAGIGGTAQVGGIGGEKMVVTINLGADHQLRFERDVTPQVIDHEEEDRL